MNIGGDDYTYQSSSQTLGGPKGALPIPLSDGRLQLHVLVDRTTVEILGNRGQAYGMFDRSNPVLMAVRNRLFLAIARSSPR